MRLDRERARRRLHPEAARHAAQLRGERGRASRAPTCSITELQNATSNAPSACGRRRPDAVTAAKRPRSSPASASRSRFSSVTRGRDVDQLPRVARAADVEDARLRGRAEHALEAPHAAAAESGAERAVDAMDVHRRRNVAARPRVARRAVAAEAGDSSAPSPPRRALRRAPGRWAAGGDRWTAAPCGTQANARRRPCNPRPTRPEHSSAAVPGSGTLASAALPGVGAPRGEVARVVVRVDVREQARDRGARGGIGARDCPRPRTRRSAANTP